MNPNNSISVFQDLKNRFKEYVDSSIQDVQLFEHPDRGPSIMVTQNNIDGQKFEYIVSSMLDIEKKNLIDLKNWFLNLETDTMYFYFIDSILIAYPDEYDLGEGMEFLTIN